MSRPGVLKFNFAGGASTGSRPIRSPLLIKPEATSSEQTAIQKDKYWLQEDEILEFQIKRRLPA